MIFHVARTTVDSSPFCIHPDPILPFSLFSCMSTSSFIIKTFHEFFLSLRNYEASVLTANMTGAEVGDISHSREFPPRVVDVTYEVLCEILADYFKSSPFLFPLPFTYITDKAQSKFR